MASSRRMGMEREREKKKYGTVFRKWNWFDRLDLSVEEEAPLRMILGFFQGNWAQNGKIH